MMHSPTLVLTSQTSNILAHGHAQRLQPGSIPVALPSSPLPPLPLPAQPKGQGGSSAWPWLPYPGKHMAPVCNVYINGLNILPLLRIQFVDLQKQGGADFSLHLDSVLCHSF